MRESSFSVRHWWAFVHNQRVLCSLQFRYPEGVAGLVDGTEMTMVEVAMEAATAVMAVMVNLEDFVEGRTTVEVVEVVGVVDCVEDWVEMAEVVVV